MNDDPTWTPNRTTNSTTSLSSAGSFEKFPVDVITEVARSDVRVFLENIRVKPADEFGADALKASGIAPSYNPPNNAFAKVPIYDPNDDVNKKVTEDDMYPKLREGFEACIKSVESTLLCLDTHKARPQIGHDLGFDAGAGPDLFITFDNEAYPTAEKPADSKDPLFRLWGPSLFYYAGIIVEVKRNVADDPPLQEVRAVDVTYTQTQAELCDQMNRYISLAQYPSNPYRYIYSITVTGPRMRLWKWTASRVVVSASFDYTEGSKGVKPLCDLLLSIKNRSSFGLNVADAPVKEIGIAAFQERMLFTTYPWKPIYDDKLTWVVSKYVDLLGLPKTRSWIKNMKNSFTWQFAIEDPKDNPKRDKIVTYLVLKHPVWRAAGVFSRGTRVYLCIEKGFFETLNVKKGDRLDLLDHTKVLKTGWPFYSRLSEIDFFNQATQVKSDDESPLCVPRVYDAGNPSELAQSRGDFMTTYELEGKLSMADKDDHVGARVARWLLFDDVGTEITNAIGTSEIVSVLRDCLQTHYALYFNGGILHRDISLNNVLINVRPRNGPRRGMLIDLDLARDIGQFEEENKFDYTLKESVKLVNGPPKDAKITPRPAMTGTIRFMAIALDHRPLHRDWHDFESFYWILVFCVVRHASKVKLVWSYFHDGSLSLDGIDNPNRRKVLAAIFRDNDATDKIARKQGAAGKLDFILHCTLSIPGNDKLETLVQDLTFVLRRLYATILAVSRAQEAIVHTRGIFSKYIPKVPEITMPYFGYANPFAAVHAGDLVEYSKVLLDAAATTRKQLIAGIAKESDLVKATVNDRLDYTDLECGAAQLYAKGLGVFPNYATFNASFTANQPPPAVDVVPFQAGKDGDSVIVVRAKPAKENKTDV